MKVLSIHLENFASYKELDFNFQDQGLTLIHGATGSGKSTLCDAIPWVLFGRTAKNGAVDEVLSWQGGEATGTILIEVSSKLHVQVRRTRKPNDLWVNAFDPNFYKPYPQTIPTRGKDIPDTQKMINNLLGFDIDLYLSGAYFHEFSQTAQFFTTNAKNRRAITEQFIDLSLPKTLNEKATAELKTKKQALQKLQTDLLIQVQEEQSIKRLILEEDHRHSKWDIAQKIKIQRLKINSVTFEEDRAKKIDHLLFEIESLDIKETDALETTIIELEILSKAPAPKCKECGHTVGDNESLVSDLAALRSELKLNKAKEETRKRLLRNIVEIEASVNTYQDQVKELEQETNPHNDGAEKAKLTLSIIENKMVALNLGIADTTQAITDLETLQDVTAIFRSHLIKNTIDSIQGKTNALLTDYFDGEIRIELAVQDSDKLEVVIAKDGNIAQFTQLSKGQRQILKLTFAIAVMQAIQQFHSVNFEQLYLDEALDGLDDNFKQKAYRLLEALSLSYNSVYVVEHSSAIKELFNNKIHVELINGVSELG